MVIDGANGLRALKKTHQEVIHMGDFQLHKLKLVLTPMVLESTEAPVSAKSAHILAQGY